MAEAGIPVDQFSLDQFSCPICLDLLRDPVTTPCGHNYCKECINGYWDQENHQTLYRCPQCRKTFTPRPDLCRNTILTEVVKRLKETEVQAAPPAHSYTGSEDVECDFCTDGQQKAFKSCLTCLTSFCETHLKPHHERPVLKKHTLVEPCGDLQEKVCALHGKLMEIYCRTDGSFICYLCTMDRHRRHDTVAVKIERTEKERELKEEQRRSQQKIQEKQKKVEQLKQAVIDIKTRSRAAEEDSELLFTQLISSIEKRWSEVRQQIRDQEEAELNQTEQLLQQVEQEIADLQRRGTEMEKLSLTHDHIHFLQNFPSLSTRWPCEDPDSIDVVPKISFDAVNRSLLRLKQRVEEFCKEEMNTLHPTAAAKPLSREDLLQYSCKLTLDPNTVHDHLVLSENNRVVRYSELIRSYPSHPERFTHYTQVLCEKGVCGRCYWEVEWSGEVGISVSYKEMKRKEESKESWFGFNDQSWSLYCSSSSSSLYFYHDNIVTNLKVPSCPRIGVYVDHSAGNLSFYSVSDTTKLLHRVQTTFTQTLYPGFYVYNKGSVRLFHLKQNIRKIN